MDARGRDAIVRGLAAVAVGTAQSGGTESAARLQFIQVLRAHGTTDPSLVLAAADAVVDQVTAEDEPDGPGEPGGLDGSDRAEDSEGAWDAEEAQRVRQALGVPSEGERALAGLTGREWLRSFAADLAG